MIFEKNPEIYRKDQLWIFYVEVKQARMISTKNTVKRSYPQKRSTKQKLLYIANKTCFLKL